MVTLEYLTVGELLFEGYLKCSAGHSKEKIPSGDLYHHIFRRSSNVLERME